MKRAALAAALSLAALGACEPYEITPAARPSAPTPPAPAVQPAPAPAPAAPAPAPPPVAVTPPPGPVRETPLPRPGVAARDQCGAADLQRLVGRPRTEIPVPVDPGRQRVACTTCPITEDYDPRRLNFFFDRETGRIREIRCG